MYDASTNVELFTEAAMYSSIIRKRMRGQFHNSNSAVLSHGLFGVDEVQKVLNANLYKDRLFTSRPNLYFGTALTRNNANLPNPLR